MLIKLVLTMALILLMLLGWVTVQALARNFARRHPELGAWREPGAGCGTGKCACASIDYCRKRDSD